MGFNNPDVSWRELERTLSDRARTGRPKRIPEGANGGDSPAWSPTRSAYVPPPVLERRVNATPYAELHCHSTFSFLDGASHPEELAEEAARLGLEALAITDHDGFYGVVRFAEAARAVGVPTVFGSELSLGLTKPQNGAPDPEGTHLLVLARDPEGYARLASTISTAQLAGAEKGKPIYEGIAWEEVHGDHWLVLTGCRKGTVPAALERHGPAVAARELDALVATFGRHNVAVELCDHGDPLDSHRNDALAQLAIRAGVDVVATTNAHYATPARRPLATAMAAVRARRSLDELDGWLPACAGAHLRSGDEQARRFARWPGAVERAAELGRACAFDLQLVAPQLPPFPCPDGLTEMAYLRRLTAEGAQRRYGMDCVVAPSGAAPLRAPGFAHPGVTSRAAPPGGVAGAPSSGALGFAHPGVTSRAAPPGGSAASTDLQRRAAVQIEHELALIEQLGFPGYFLVVWDIVDFCRRSNIYCQGRGSAANSAVCYALGITNADAVQLGLLFERFLSPERDGPPDIDIDIESGRREEAIQYVYAKHGRRHAAQVANVITYRAKSSIRDVAKALGYAPGQQDAWSKQVDAWGGVAVTAAQQEQERKAAQPPGGAAREVTPGWAKPRRPEEGRPAEQPPDGAAREVTPGWAKPRRPEEGRPAEQIPADVLALAAELEHAPRHLGIHSGGMVICDRPIVEVCPVEWARMEDRSVLQWDKDDCAAIGLVKFDLLGLGMLEVLHGCIDLVRDVHGDTDVDLATLPQEDEVYDMLCRADSVGVFQVESRAQMATLPRLRPREFYDLVVEVALIRPGPIQGGSVHPYIRRRNGQEDVTYLHPLLEPSLRKTLGVPLFQEQLMQMAIDVGGFSPGEADMLRQAMGSKRSRERMERLHQRFADGAAERGVSPDVIEIIWEKLAAFASYGFPESHSVSFAYLVYASSWLKRWYPAAFCAALLDAQPMGFYAPHTLVQDARRHGVEVRTPDLNASAATASLEPCVAGRPSSGRLGFAHPGVADPAAPPGGAAREMAPGSAEPSGPEEGPPAVQANAAQPPGGAARGMTPGSAEPSGPGEGPPAARSPRDAAPEDWGRGGPAVRLGISYVRGIGDDLAEEIAAGRPYADPEDLARRVPLTLPQLEALATSGAFDCFGMSRREAIWAAGAVAQMGTDRHGAQRLPGIVTGVSAPDLPVMAGEEQARADLWSTGVSPEGHPTRFVREHLTARGVVTATGLADVEPGTRVLVGGVVTHRQRPATAGGTLFVNLEDETGLVNVVVSKGCWTAHRKVARTAPAMLVRGRLERSEGVTNVIADRLEWLPLSAPTKSRDFR